jgi:hypothetical protein
MEPSWQRPEPPAVLPVHLATGVGYAKAPPSQTGLSIFPDGAVAPPSDIGRRGIFRVQPDVQARERKIPCRNLFVAALLAGAANCVTDRGGQRIAHVLEARRICEENYTDTRQENKHRPILRGSCRVPG